MKITNKLYLKQSGDNVTLYEKITCNRLDGNRNPTGETYESEKDISYFGNIYQALQYIVRSQYDIEQPLKEQILENISLIDKAEEDIKKRFRIEVRSAKS